MTTDRGFASMPSPLLWIMAAFFAIPGLYDVMTGMSQEPLEDVLLNIAELAVGAFLLYCAVQAWRGRRTDLASSRITRIGYFCFGLFGLCFVVKMGVTAIQVGLFY